MRTRIRGRLTAVVADKATVAVEAFDFEVMIPEYVRRALQSQVGEDVALHTLEYLEGNPTQGRLTPRLVGFSTEVEREFFEMFCSVDGVGVRKALRAMVKPVRDVAGMIADQDAKGLSTLPGIGPATSERVIAKLRRKMAKFALLVARDDLQAEDVPDDVVADTYQILCSLGHSEADARRLLDRALAKGRRFADTDALLRAVYETSQDE